MLAPQMHPRMWVIAIVLVIVGVTDTATAQNLPLPSLPYAYDALEPYIDEQTMRTHHLKHHQSYTDNVNAALSAMRATPEHKSYAKAGIDSLLARLASVPGQYRDVIRNHGGGYVNHAFFWQCMQPPQPPAPADADAATPVTPPLPAPTPSSPLSTAIIKAFGSIDQFRTLFEQSAASVFGSGWNWLFVNGTDGGGRLLHIGTTSNQDTPVMNGDIPILALDVWEHAYYLKYQNRRKEYVHAWWNIVNWRFAESNYASALGLPATSTKDEL